MYHERVETFAQELKTRQVLLEISRTRYDETKVETDRNLLTKTLCCMKVAVVELSLSGEGC